MALLRRAKQCVRGDDLLMTKRMKHESDSERLRVLLQAAIGGWGTSYRMGMLILVERLAAPWFAGALVLGITGLP